MVHPGDPLGPGEIFDSLANVCELPIKERGYPVLLGVDQDVLWPEVPVSEHLTGPRDLAQRVDGNLLHRLQKLAAESECHVDTPSFDQVLTMRPLDE
jgi:hypothetical protein